MDDVFVSCSSRAAPIWVRRRDSVGDSPGAVGVSAETGSCGRSSSSSESEAME